MEEIFYVILTGLFGTAIYFIGLTQGYSEGFKFDKDYKDESA